MSKLYLKVKVCSLAAEARIIKRQERRFPKGRRNHPHCIGLREHRVYVVRTEARSSHLAYGFLRGRAYRQMEDKCYDPPNWSKVEAIADRFGKSSFKDERDFNQKFAAWKAEAKEHLASQKLAA